MRHTGTIERGACRGGRERGFALAELLAVLIMLIAIGAVIGAFMPDARRRSQMSGSLTNLQRLGAAAADYGMENADSVFSFTWRASAMGQRCDNGDDTYTFPPASTDLQAAANQAICILRRQGRRDIQQITGWIPHIQYNHLALADYLGEQLPSRLFVSPGDRLRLEWQDAVTRNPANPRQGFFDLACRPFGNTNNESRWPYSSSYEIPPAFFSPDATMNNVPTISQAPEAHYTYYAGDNRTPVGRRILSEIRHPSQKAMMFETNQRFFGQRQLYFMYPEARVPVLLCDGSAAVRSTSNANRGFNPSTPTNSGSTRVNYTPDVAWETPTSSGAPTQFVNGTLRWTRSGLRGRDYGGPEVPWVP